MKPPKVKRKSRPTGYFDGVPETIANNPREVIGRVFDTLSFVGLALGVFIVLDRLGVLGKPLGTPAALWLLVPCAGFGTLNYFIARYFWRTGRAQEEEQWRRRSRKR